MTAARRSRHPVRRTRSRVRRLFSWGWPTTEGLQGADHARWASSALALARKHPAGGHHARRGPARYGRPGGARSAQARPYMPPHSRPRHLRREDGEQSARTSGLRRLKKPVSKKTLDDAFGRIRTLADSNVKNLLVVEDNEVERNSIVGLLGREGVEIQSVATAAEALRTLRTGRVDCLVLDLRLAGHVGGGIVGAGRCRVRPGRDAGDRLHGQGSHRGGIDAAEGPEQDDYLQGRARRNGCVRRPMPFCGRLRPAARGLHGPPSDGIRRDGEPMLEGKKVLVVDDDVRNIFALTSILERWEVRVCGRERAGSTGSVGEPDVSLVLMDIMMPGMDGYQTMREIRKAGVRRCRSSR